MTEPIPYNPPDYYLVDELLTAEQKLVRQSVRDWVNREVKPVIEDLYEKAIFPVQYIKQLGELGALGIYIPQKYGGAGLDYISYGLAMQELERGDSGLRSAASVQTSLVMYPVFEFGDDHQKEKYLPGLAKGELVGCFGLTESESGSDPGSMRTRITKKGDYYILNGSKMWITNSSIADIAVVWAKDEQDVIRGLIVEKGMHGFSAPGMHNKLSLRASVTGELVFDNVKIPEQNILPRIAGLKGPLKCLSAARYGIAWGVMGIALECYDVALRYASERKQFGKPIASFQLQQKKFSETLTAITQAQLLAWRLGVLRNEGRATPAQISMAKRNNVELTLKIAREMRQVLGANGITSDYPMMRHMANLESVITYEGTHDIHLLITGQDITGIDAFR